MKLLIQVAPDHADRIANTIRFFSDRKTNITEARVEGNVVYVSVVITEDTQADPETNVRLFTLINLIERVHGVTMVEIMGLGSWTEDGF